MFRSCPHLPPVLVPPTTCTLVLLLRICSKVVSLLTLLTCFPGSGIFVSVCLLPQLGHSLAGRSRVLTLVVLSSTSLSCDTVLSVACHILSVLTNVRVSSLSSHSCVFLSLIPNTNWSHSSSSRVMVPKSQ